MEDRLPRKLAAILYADVAGYSRLTGDDEDATHRTLGEYLDLISTTVKFHRGQVMHYAGDAVLARFDAVVDALSSAVTIQNEINTLNEEVPDNRKVKFRIGVNLGDVIEDRGDIYGDGVNVAARLESLAEPGGICVSESVRLALGNKLPLEFECMGEQEVKNIAEPVTAYRTARQGSSEKTGSESAQRSPALPDRPSIAVLPFKNIAGGADDDYFVEGITEEVMTGLSRFREIVVAARGSSFLVGSQSLDISEAASKLGVQYVLEGNVRKAGNRVRVTAKLIEGATGHQIWSDRYDRVLDDIFEVQDDVAQKIVVTLVGRIERSDQARSLRKETSNLSAYEYVLRGRHLYGEWGKGHDDDDIRRAREMFERAIELDEGYAAAYAGLAATYLEEFEREWTETPEVAGARALELARKAIELDGHDSYAHLVLSSAYWHVKSNFELARTQLEVAIELNPNYYWNYCYGCWFSVCAGDLDISVKHGNEALRRNPLLPDGCLWTLGFTEYLAGRYANAIATLGRRSVLEPESLACLAAAYAQLGRDEEARVTADEFRDQVETGSMNVPGWRSYWAQYLKVRDRKTIDHLIEGLAKAGLVSR